MDYRLKKFDVFRKLEKQQSQKRLDSTRRLEDKSFLQLKQYKNEFIRTPSNTNTCQTQMRKLRLKLKPQLSQNQVLSYSHSIQNIEILPNRQLDPKVVKLLIPNQKRTTQQTYFGAVTARSYQNKCIDKQNSSPFRRSSTDLRQGDLAPKSQFQASLLLYKKQRNIPIQVKLSNQEEIKKEFQYIRNKFAKSKTELDFHKSNDQLLKVKPCKAKFHLCQQIVYDKNYNINNNSVESQTNLDLEYLEELKQYEKIRQDKKHSEQMQENP